MSLLLHSVKNDPKEFFAARVPPEVLEVLRAEADRRGVKVSEVAREAFDLYIRVVIENRCPVCEAANPRDVDWCGACGAAVTRAALKAGSVKLNEHLAHVANQIADAKEILEQVTAMRDRARGKATGEEIPPSARPRPPGEQNIISEEQT